VKEQKSETKRGKIILAKDLRKQIEAILRGGNTWVTERRIELLSVTCIDTEKQDKLFKAFWERLDTIESSLRSNAATKLNDLYIRKLNYYRAHRGEEGDKDREKELHSIVYKSKHFSSSKEFQEARMKKKNEREFMKLWKGLLVRYAVKLTSGKDTLTQLGFRVKSQSEDIKQANNKVGE